MTAAARNRPRGGEAPAVGRWARIGRAGERVVFAGLALGLAAAPFWFGSDRLIAWGVNAAYYASLAILFEISRGLSGSPHAVHIRHLWGPALLVAGVASWIVVQLLPLQPHAHPLWAMAAEVLGQPLAGAISISPDQTALALLRLASAVLLFWLALQTCRAPARARRLVAAVAMIGGVYALYGLVAFFAIPDTVLWFPKVTYNDALTSTFINRNSYATYAGLGLVCAVALATTQLAGAGGGDWRFKMARLVGGVVGPGGLWLAVTFVLGVALILTGSRGGVSATLAGLIFLTGLAAVRGRAHAGALGVSISLAVILVGVAFFAFGDFFAERLATNGFRSDDRLAVYRLTLQSAADAPLTGFGYGGFAQIFPMYRDDTVGPFGLWDRAHNTYVEALQGLGAPAAGAFLLALAWLAGRCLLASLRRAHGTTAPLAAAAAAVVVGLHAFVDFSLQVQAVTLTFAALLGAGVAQSWSSKFPTNG